MTREPGAFATFSRSLAAWSGRPASFYVAGVLVLAWAITGPAFGFSDTWQLVINTGTSVVTFLMVFLIQNTQNRDTQAMQLKLDEIIRANDGMHNSLIALEDLDEEELARVRRRYLALAEEARSRIGRGEGEDRAA